MNANDVQPRYMTGAVVQGPTGQGGMSHLLPTNVDEIDILYHTSTRNYIIRTNLQLQLQILS